MQYPIAVEPWQQHFRTLGALTADGVLVLSGAGTVLYCNPVARALLGPLRDARGDAWLDRVRGAERAEAVASWQTALSTGEPWERRLCFEAADDAQERWIDCHAVPEARADGGGRVWTIVWQDVSAVMRAEQRRDRFLASTSDLVAHLDLATLAFTRANPALVRTLGHDPSLAAAAPHWGGLHPADEARAAGHALKLRQGLPLQLELRHRHRDGSYRVIAWTVYPVLEQGLAMGIGRDLTSQARLAAEHRRLAHVVEQCGDLMAIASRDGAILYMNPAGLALAGWPGYDSDVRIASLFPAPSRAALDAALRQAVASDEPWEGQADIVNAQSGEIVPVHAKAFAIHLPDDARACGLLARDLRDWRRAEAAFRSHDKLAAMGRVAAAVAHEINNPLATAVNLTYLLGVEAGLPEGARAHVRQLEQELDRIATLSKQTLSYFRPLPAVAALPFSELTDSVCRAFRARAAACGVELRSDIAEAVLVPGSANELRQVVTNLLGNALDAVLASYTKCIHLRLRLSNNPGGARCARLSIADSGSGFQGDRERLFDPFYTTKGANGSGLGLWVSREIIEQHHGRIQCRNLPSGGACFSILLPAS